LSSYREVNCRSRNAQVNKKVEIITLKQSLGDNGGQTALQVSLAIEEDRLCTAIKIKINNDSN
jgi:hypothetical protein